MSQIEDHPLRYALANELHARPFPSLEAPAHAAYLAIKPVDGAAARKRGEDIAHLTALLDRFGAPHPQPGATHYFGEVGAFNLKWEQHTEFASYTIFAKGVADRPFDKAAFDVFPEDWLAATPGVRVTSALVRVEKMAPIKAIRSKLDNWFVAESLAVSRILSNAAVMAGDFRIDSGGHMRFCVFVEPGTGPRRVGRIVQRICEIETYKAMSMLGLSQARELSDALGKIDIRLEALTEAMAGQCDRADEILEKLLGIASKLESLLAKSNFRFSATRAYAALVNQRIEVLREEHFEGAQTFREFMARRFDPAVRTVEATERRLVSMAERAARADDLLRTRVDVERSAQNQALLESMDRRAGLQLRLQRTVEGLSVVAISYYAVNLARYLIYPIADPLEIPRTVVTAALTPAVVLFVWLMVRRIRRGVEQATQENQQ